MCVYYPLLHVKISYAHFPHLLMLIVGVVVIVVACDLRDEGEFSVPF
jgi:hypothetical protein